MTDRELLQELRDKAAVEGAGSTRRLLELAARRIESQQWISVGDGIPEDGQRVLTLAEYPYAWKNNLILTNSIINGEWDFVPFGRITHWMPLPELPEVDE